MEMGNGPACRSLLLGVTRWQPVPEVQRSQGQLPQHLRGHPPHLPKFRQYWQHRGDGRHLLTGCAFVSVVAGSKFWATQGSVVHGTVFPALTGQNERTEKKLRSATVAADRTRGPKCLRQVQMY